MSLLPRASRRALQGSLRAAVREEREAERAAWLGRALEGTRLTHSHLAVLGVLSPRAAAAAAATAAAAAGGDLQLRVEAAAAAAAAAAAPTSTARGGGALLREAHAL